MNNDDDAQRTVDWFNVAYVLTSAAVVAQLGWPLIIILWPLYYGQKALRNTPAVREWRNNLLTAANSRIPLLPGPKAVVPYTRSQSNVVSTRIPVPQEKTRTVDPYAHLPLWERVTKPYDTTPAPGRMNNPYGRNSKVSTDERQMTYLNQALKRLPPYFHYTQLPDELPSRLSVPIGIDAETMQVLWGDFDSDSDRARILHALIAGQTGAGKDAILRLWFTTLTLNNTPEEIQFVILDGKIDWLSQELASSVYMAIPPAGGIQIRKVDGKRVDCSKEKMAESLDWVFEEVERRSELLRKAGAINLNAYNAKMLAKGDKTLPMLFLIASDVGKAFDGDLGMLVELLIMKGRAFGIRMIISMQDPVGEGTGWRAQIGLVMSGYQQDPLHDHRIMGINVGRLVVRPSQLPNPEEDDIAKGLFIVRQGSKQAIVRTPHLPEEDWFNYIESNRFHKRWYDKSTQDTMLAELLNIPSGITRRLEPIAPQILELNPADVLTHDQIVLIAQLSLKRMTKTDIMVALGFTNQEVWDKKKKAVESVIIAARGQLKITK